jgi:hypothetical protein
MRKVGMYKYISVKQNITYVRDGKALRTQRQREYVRSVPSLRDSCGSHRPLHQYSSTYSKLLSSSCVHTQSFGRAPA